MTTEPDVLHIITTDAEGRRVKHPQTQYALPIDLGPRTLTLEGQTATTQPPEVLRHLFPWALGTDKPVKP